MVMWRGGATSTSRAVRWQTSDLLIAIVRSAPNLSVAVVKALTAGLTRDGQHRHGCKANTLLKSPRGPCDCGFTVVPNRADRDTFLFNRCERAASRYDFEAVLHESSGEIREAALVRDANERSARWCIHIHPVQWLFVCESGCP